jgi:hypothetical protein
MPFLYGTWVFEDACFLLNIIRQGQKNRLMSCLTVTEKQVHDQAFDAKGLDRV